uniref:Alanine and arginine rich domain containing protein n=1 Tax=Equus asinus TaxID=9793 RepID=A0A9L0JBE5_EQUAS
MGPGRPAAAETELPAGPAESQAGPGSGRQPRVPRAASPGAGGQSVSAPEEAPAARQLLEDLRRRLASAFQRAAAREQQSRACIEGALGRLSAELLEMHFQNRQLVRTVLDLNMKMQQLKKEYELEIASKSQSSEDNALNRE